MTLLFYVITFTIYRHGAAHTSEAVYWLGGRKTNGGDYHGPDGEPLVFTAWDGITPTQTCTVMNCHQKQCNWETLACTESHRYICKKMRRMYLIISNIYL